MTTYLPAALLFLAAATIFAPGILAILRADHTPAARSSLGSPPATLTASERIYGTQPWGGGL